MGPAEAGQKVSFQIAGDGFNFTRYTKGVAGERIETGQAVVYTEGELIPFPNLRWVPDVRGFNQGDRV